MPVSKAKDSQQARTPRGLSRPTPELDEIFRLVNLVPAGFELPERLVSLEPILEQFRTGRYFDPLPGDIEDQFRNSLRGLPEELSELRQHLLNIMDLPEAFSGDGVLHAVRRYDEIRQWRASLHAIARREPFMPTYGVAIIDWEKGSLVYGKNAFEWAIDGVDLRNIGVCSAPGCGRFFFAYRLSYRGKEIDPRCSAKCGEKIRELRRRLKESNEAG